MASIKNLRRAKSDIIMGIVGDLFAVGFYLETYHFRLVRTRNTVNAAFFPRIMAVLVFICASVVLFQGLKRYFRIPKNERVIPDEEKHKDRAGLFRIAQVFAVLLVSAIFFRTLGFLLTMPCMMFLLFIILEKKENRRYGLYLFFSIFAPVFMFVVFYYGFSTLLPMGILTPYLAQIL